MSPINIAPLEERKGWGVKSTSNLFGAIHDKKGKYPLTDFCML